MLCVQRALCTVFPAANEKKGEKGQSFPPPHGRRNGWNPRLGSQQPWWGEDDEAVLPSHGRGSVVGPDLCAQPPSCSGTEGRHVTNLFAPGSFSKCSDKSLCAWKSWKLWLSYKFNSKMKTLCPFPSNTRTRTDVWWLGLSSCSPDLGVEPVTLRDTTTVLPTLLSQGYTTAHRCLERARLAEMSPSHQSQRGFHFLSHNWPSYSRGIDETLTGTTQTQGQAHGLESSKPSEWL